jgi:poly(hydroxyalkanoate) granule-associated protein
MVKKLKELAADAGDGGTGNLAQTIRDSAQQIWLAGLGAFGKTQQEGGKVFEALVKEGKTLESRTRKIAGSAIEGLTAKVGKNTMAAASKATATWDTLEQVFQDRVARAMGRMGVPTQSDLQALVERVERLEKRGGAPFAAKRRAPVAKKAAGKTSRSAKRGA